MSDYINACSLVWQTVFWTLVVMASANKLDYMVVEIMSFILVPILGEMCLA
jgi:hypothetical protein